MLLLYVALEKQKSRKGKASSGQRCAQTHPYLLSSGLSAQQCNRRHRNLTCSATEVVRGLYRRYGISPIPKDILCYFILYFEAPPQTPVKDFLKKVLESPKNLQTGIIKNYKQATIAEGRSPLRQKLVILITQ